MTERGRSTYYRMLHFIVGEASPLCPTQEKTQVREEEEKGAARTLRLLRLP